MSSVRRATHAGSGYVRSAKDLSKQLENWLKIAGAPSHAPARAIIAPHARYRYCGACSAYAYKQVDPTITKRVFILGPSHNVRLSGCALSSLQTYSTPLGDLSIDLAIYDELYSTGEFEEMSLMTDEDEHSIEMQLPFIAKVMESHQFTIVPVLVGSLSTEGEYIYGKIFSRYLSDPSNLFVISSDFCRWGARFRYQFYDNSWGQIYKSIEKLDEMAMNIIEKMSPTAFASYLKNYMNTICGRHPIGVLLNAISSLKQSGNGIQPSLKFLKYAQSSRCLNDSDSSVSYAAASLVIV